MRRADVRAAAGRIAVVRAGLLLALLVLAVRAAHLSVLDGRGADLGRRQFRHAITLAADRGAILDRGGAELALTVDAPSVYAIAGEIPDRAAAVRALARALGRDAGPLAERLRGRDGFAFLARWVEPERAERVSALDLPGVGVLHEPRRVYPHGGLAAQMIGFANIDGVGVRGVEQQEDAWLRGEEHRVPVGRDARGRLLVTRGTKPWSTAGGDVALTLDAALQADAEEALAAAVRATRADAGVVVSLDPYSGDVLSLAEWPGFDPNDFRNVPYPATRSRSFLDAADPGSTLKAFLVAAALERGAIGPDDRIDCEDGSFRVPGKTIRDLRAHGELSPAGILRVSSNIGAVKIAQALGADAHFDMLRRFGFGETTRSGFPDESSGVLRPAEGWRPVDHATIAFGQGVSVTPVQMAAATAALANGGLWVRPRLVAARRAPGGSWEPTPHEVRRVIRPQTAGAVLAMLEEVTRPGGTGRRAALRGVRVAGKTGTAQKFDAEAGRYADDRFVAWFLGAVPADAPRLVIVVALDEPRGSAHTGGSAAAPLFARVAAAQLARFGILTAPLRSDGTGGPGHDGPAPAERDRGETRTASAAPTPPEPAPPAPVATPAVATVSAPPPSRPPERPEPPVIDLAPVEDRVLLPDFRGLTVAEVRRITAETALDVEITGSGRAVAQEPPPGTILAVRAARVRIRFAPAGAGGGES